ncbi:hypothetical protein EJB05_15127, partial [Eragrostis curvula]
MTMGGRITVSKSTLVRPAQETPRRRLWLSSLDLGAPRMHLPSVRFYRHGGNRPDGGDGVPPADNEGSRFFDGERMRRALAEALVPFYPMAGRLGHDGDGRLEIDCNGEGVLFVEADAADTTVDDYGDFAPTAELRRLVPAVGEYTDDVSALPLLLLQVTYFKCGGVCLGVATDHYVSDGMSTSHFVNSWAELCRGTKISSVPYIDRTLLRAREPPTPSFRHVEYLPPPAALPATAKLLLSASDESTPPATAVDIFKLTLSDLARLRAQLPSRVDDVSQPRRLSMYAVVAAHVWRCVSLARGLPPDQPTMLIAAVDGRSRLPLPAGFLGNVVFSATPISEASTVMTRGAAAGVVQAALDRMDGDYCRSALDCLEMQPEHLSDIARRRAATFWYNLVVTSWVRMRIHDADFGWGRPVFMGPGGIAKEGLAFVLPSADGDGSLSVAVCLRAEHMDKFRVLMYDNAIGECSTTRCSKM